MIHCSTANVMPSGTRTSKPAEQPFAQGEPCVRSVCVDQAPLLAAGAGAGRRGSGCGRRCGCRTRRGGGGAGRRIAGLGCVARRGRRAGAVFLPPPSRKSVAYQPEPLSWKPAAVTCFSNALAPQFGHTVSVARRTSSAGRPWHGHRHCTCRRRWAWEWVQKSGAAAARKALDYRAAGPRPSSPAPGRSFRRVPWPAGDAACECSPAIAAAANRPPSPRKRQHAGQLARECACPSASCKNSSQTPTPSAIEATAPWVVAPLPVQAHHQRDEGGHQRDLVGGRHQVVDRRALHRDGVGQHRWR
jgi:hypothetical protein